MDVPFVEPSEIRSFAQNLRRSAFGDDPPIPVDLETLLYDYLYDEHEVAFYNDQLLGDEDQQDVLGKTDVLDGAIYVDRQLAEDGHRGRYRFTLAHEIGHWTLHRPESLKRLADGDDADPDGSTFVTLERDVDEPDRPDDGYRPEEYQANVFAIWLLLPNDALEEAFRERFGEPPVECPDDLRDPDREESLREGSRELAATSKDGLDPLYDHFELSIESTAIALEERGYVE